jgi:hypothetical protein
MKYNNKHMNTALLVVVLLMNITTGCKKWIEVPPPETSVVKESVFSNNGTAIAVLNNLYSGMSSSGSFPGSSVIPSIALGLTADELTIFSGASNQSYLLSYSNSLTGRTGISSPNYFGGSYYSIFSCNAAIDGLTASTALTPAVKQQLLGEAKFMRAYIYFYLVNLYGDVPLTTSVDYSKNRLLNRASAEVVYSQIISDLKEAKSLLSENYLDGSLLLTTSERVRPTKWSAVALLARAYLYRQNWADAEAEATVLINNTSQFSLIGLNDAFLKNNKEAIWQLQPVTTGVNTLDAWIFDLAESGKPTNVHPVYISPQLLSAFEADDLRRKQWVDSITVSGTRYYFPRKYKASRYGSLVTEYTMVFRLAEQYLIRAEARTQQENISGAREDIRVVRQRAGLGNTSANSKSTLISAIMHERQVELFTEWGQRWFDLKRTNTIDAVMTIVTPLKGGTWNSYDKWFPIPESDLIADPNLEQTTGY